MSPSGLGPLLVGDIARPNYDAARGAGSARAPMTSMVGPILYVQDLDIGRTQLGPDRDGMISAGLSMDGGITTTTGPDSAITRRAAKALR